MKTPSPAPRLHAPSFLSAFVLLLVGPAHGQQRPPEFPPIPRVLPPEGLEIPADTRTRLQTRLAETKKRFQAAAEQMNPDRPESALDRADIEVFIKAVEFALLHREFYVEKDVEKADWALDEANKRIDALAHGQAPWSQATGLVVRGYTSSIDSSPQPYGLVIPENHQFNRPCPLYVWLHGRGDKSTDLHFLHERATRKGQIAPPDAIVLHPFGRHCVGFKHAGEMDVLQAIAVVKTRYKVDPDRVVLIGFSMGGAGAWHIGAHYTDQFVAVAPGAGFAETARYQRLTPDRYPPWYEQKLWGLYDVPNYVRNLFNTRVIAYSGELDRQIQAARVMEQAYQTEGRTLEHLIGPGVEHRYEPKTLVELLSRLKTVVDSTDREQFLHPDRVHLQTRTLRYARQKWIAADALEEHWSDARIDGEQKGNTIVLTTTNVARIHLTLPLPWAEFDVTIDGQRLGPLHHVQAGALIAGGVTKAEAYLVKKEGRWQRGEHDAPQDSLRKRPFQQGPIDDAFMSPFVVVAPTGKSRNPHFQAWCAAELAHFLDRWRALMRGEPLVVRDVEWKSSPLAARKNLVLWGDPDSNSAIRELLADMPLRFTNGNWTFSGQTLDGDRFVPALIWPATKIGRPYLVLNSGLTFREGHDRTNSLQNPKLPDWAIIDITQPPDAFAPGRIHAAGFFDENWQFKAPSQAP